MTPTLRRRRNQSTDSALPALGSPSRRICAATVDEKGKTREKVYDVVWSGGRERGPDGKLPPVKNTVDLATATYLDVEGAPSLYGFWSDPEFNAEFESHFPLQDWLIVTLDLAVPRFPSCAPGSGRLSGRKVGRKRNRSSTPSRCSAQPLRAVRCHWPAVGSRHGLNVRRRG